MQKQGSIVHPLRDLANCSKLRMANVGWAEFKPHLRGSLGHGPNQHKRAVPRRGHGAKSLTQHRHAGPSANSGSVDTVPEPSGCTPLSLSSCDHRQAALSASGCECSLPEMAMKTCKQILFVQTPHRNTSISIHRWSPSTSRARNIYGVMPRPITIPKKVPPSDLDTEVG